MTALTAIVLVLTCLAGLVWVSRHVLIHREQRGETPLSPDAPGPEGECPPISVVVAAKDEEATIETCLRTMLRQDYPNFEIVVCNDRSEDRTGEIIDRIAAEDPRVRAMHVEHLPEGWFGKSHAMHKAIATTDSPWICMIDADCRQDSSRTLSVAMARALREQTDLLSILPSLEMRGFWENAVQPVCSGVMMIWFRPDKVNDPDRPNAYANGAFMMMPREAYVAVGGHEAVKDRLNEDMHLARLVKDAGLRLRVARSRGLYTVRMYEGLAAVAAGWTRIFLGTFGTLRRLLASIGLMLWMSLLCYVAAIGGLTLRAAGAEPAGWWLACGLAGVAVAALQMSVIVRFYRLSDAKPTLAWTYPIGCGIALYCLLRAVTKLRPGSAVLWRGTNYQQARSE